MKGIKQLVVCGVTTEVCVHTSVREANDRGYDALVLSDAVGSYFPEFQRVALEMVKAPGGIFGWVSDSERFLAALATAAGREPVAGGAAVGWLGAGGGSQAEGVEEPCSSNRPPTTSRDSGSRATGTPSSGSARTSS